MSEWNPKNLNLVCYLRGREGVINSGQNITSLLDLTINGNNFTPTSVPLVSEDLINGINGVKFPNSTSISKSFPFNGLLTTNKKSGWIVYRMEDNSQYHNIIFTGGNIVQDQLYISNDTNNFTHVFNTDTLESTTSKGIGITINNNEVRIGQWSNKGSSMVMCEFGLINQDTNPLTNTDITNLKAYFKAKYKSIIVGETTTVVNQGVNGNNTSDVIARLPTINAQNGNLVIVMLGTNDWRYPIAGNRRTPAQYEANLTTIVQSLKSNGSEVLLMTMPPIINQESDYVCPFYGQSSGCDANATGDQFRAKVALVATAQNVKFLDMNQKFIDIGQPTYSINSYMENALNSASTDGVHPRPIGATFIAQKIYDYLGINALYYPKIVCVGDSITWGDGLTGGGTATGQTYPGQLKLLLG